MESVLMLVNFTAIFSRLKKNYNTCSKDLYFNWGKVFNHHAFFKKDAT